MAIFRAREGYETISLGDCFAESGHFFLCLHRLPDIVSCHKVNKLHLYSANVFRLNFAGLEYWRSY